MAALFVYLRLNYIYFPKHSDLFRSIISIIYPV